MRNANAFIGFLLSAAVLLGCAGAPPSGENERSRTWGEKAWDAVTLTAPASNPKVRYTVDCDSLTIHDSKWTEAEKTSLCSGDIPLGISKAQLDFFFIGPFLDRGSHAYYQKSRIVFWRVDFEPSGNDLIAAKARKWLNRDHMP